MSMDGWEGGRMNDEDGTVCGYVWGWGYIRNVLIWVGYVTLGSFYSTLPGGA